MLHMYIGTMCIIPEFLIGIFYIFTQIIVKYYICANCLIWRCSGGMRCTRKLLENFHRGKVTANYEGGEGATKYGLC